MNNKMLSLVMAVSTLMLPTIASARLTNETIFHRGHFEIEGAQTLTLSEHAGNSITLNNGALDIKSTKVKAGYSLFNTQLVIKQNGQSMYIDIDTRAYMDDKESFNLKATHSDLNYDLYLRKKTISTNEIQTLQVAACTYKQFGTKCSVDIEGKYNCTSALQDRLGTQQVRNTNAEITNTYKLTLAQNNIAKAVFTSAQTTTELKKTEVLTVCR